MAEPTAGELKLIQYLNEAYGKEKQLETVLQAQIQLAQKPALEKRLKEHLQETRDQAKGLERRIKALGGKAEIEGLPGPQLASEAASRVASLANKALAAAKGPVQALRGTSPADNQLRNARDAYWNEAEEIAHYIVIEAAADQLGDAETVRLAKDFRRQEERMQGFLEKQLPQLVKDVIKTEIPKEQREVSASSSRGRSSRAAASGRSPRSSGDSSTRSSRATRSGGSSRSRASSGRSGGSGGSSSGGSAGDGGGS